jgi:hypothetical protein
MQLMTRADTTGHLCRVGFLIAIGGVAASSATRYSPLTLASLEILKIDDTTITAAESVPQGHSQPRLEDLRQSAGLLPGDRHPIARARFGDPRRNVASAGPGRASLGDREGLRRPVRLFRPGGGAARAMPSSTPIRNNSRHGAERRRLDAFDDCRRQADRSSLLGKGPPTPISPAARPAANRR